jgi:hypothetical protein
MRFYNSNIVDKNTVHFDVQLSNGQILKSIKFNSSDIPFEAKCPYCWPIAYIVKEIAEAIIESSGDSYDSNCNNAIDSCGDAGVDEIEIIDGGWFGESSCTVTCN